VNWQQRIWRLPATRWVLVGSSALLLVFDAYDVSIFPKGSVDPAVVGSVGDWVAGFATAGAVAVAGYGLRTDRRRIEAEEVTRRNAAASEVYAWLERPHLRPGRVRDVVLVTLNQTSVPIYDWALSIEGLPDVALGPNQLGPILPGERHHNVSKAAADLEENSAELVRVAISFQTSLGIRVSRGFEGLIHEVTA